MYLRASTQSSSVTLDYKLIDLLVSTMTTIMAYELMMMFADQCGSRTGDLERSSSSSRVCIPTFTTTHSHRSFIQPFQALSEHLRRLTLRSITYGMSGTAVRRVQKVSSRHHFAHSRRAADIPNTVCMASTGIRRHSQVAQQAYQGRGR
jgi:hypothetical protein